MSDRPWRDVRKCHLLQGRSRCAAYVTGPVDGYGTKNIVIAAEMRGACAESK